MIRVPTRCLRDASVKPPTRLLTHHFFPRAHQVHASKQASKNGTIVLYPSIHSSPELHNKLPHPSPRPLSAVYSSPPIHRLPTVTADMDDQSVKSIFEALGPAEAPEKQEILTDAKPYLAAPPVARLVAALLGTVNFEKQARERSETEYNRLIAYLRHGDFVSRYLHQYRPLLQEVGVDDWIAFGRFVKDHGGWSYVHDCMKNTIRQIRPGIDADALELERKALSHGITFYCHRVYKAHAILDHMSEQEVWAKMNANVVHLKHDHCVFESSLSP